jgi:hypothetical protein
MFWRIWLFPWASIFQLQDEVIALYKDEYCQLVQSVGKLSYNEYNTMSSAKSIPWNSKAFQFIVLYISRTIFAWAITIDAHLDMHGADSINKVIKLYSSLTISDTCVYLYTKIWHLIHQTFAYDTLLTVIWEILEHCFGLRQGASFSCKWNDRARLCCTVAPRGWFKNLEQ